MYKQKAATYDMDQVVSCEVVGRWEDCSETTLTTIFSLCQRQGPVDCAAGPPGRVRLALGRV